jgi:hypothetical protein
VWACYQSGVRPLAVLLSACALLVETAPALAAEGESMLSVTPSYATFSIVVGEGNDAEQIDATGGNLLIEYERGLSDVLWFRAASGGGLYRAAGETSWSASGVAGITYALDVLKYVPYANLGAGAMVIGGGPFDTEVKAYLELGFGLDVLQSRSFSWGVAIRYDSFASQISYFTLGARATWHWGYW